MEADVFIIGADGLIGSRLVERAEKNRARWVGTSRKNEDRKNILTLDLRNSDEIQNLTIRPQITYLCAAETDLRKCQNHPAETRALNVERTVQAARHLAEAGSAIVFLSTNLVFDGNRPEVPADAEPNPVTEYGRQKAEVEKILLNELDRVAIVRLTKVVHADFPLFQEWLATLKTGNPIRPFSNMMFSPIDIDVVAGELWALSQSFEKGIFQLSGDADISYAAAASLLAQSCALDAGLVKPQTTGQAGYLHAFPKHTALAYRPIRPQQKPEPVSVTLERIFRSIRT
jgi:dTDP-4-dehydrorhamnose reductase